MLHLNSLMKSIKGDIKMMKQMKRTVYEAPVTERFQVELEGAHKESKTLRA